MPELRCWSRLQAIVALTFLLSVFFGGSAHAAGSDFTDISDRVKKLWMTEGCFGPSYTRAVSLIADCWDKFPERREVAQTASLELAAELDTVMQSSGNYGLALRTKLNLLTKSGLFCDVPSIDPAQKLYIANAYGTFYEYASDLLMCARAQGRSEVYEELRGVLQNDFGRFARGYQIELLKLWFDSYAFQYDPPGDLQRIADALNANERGSWQNFTSAIRHVARRYPRFPSQISVAELRAVRNVLYSS